jgi:hypothetical protein
MVTLFLPRSKGAADASWILRTVKEQDEHDRIILDPVI